MGIIRRILFGESDQPKSASNSVHPDVGEDTETESEFIDSTRYRNEHEETDHAVQIIQMRRRRRDHYYR